MQRRRRSSRRREPRQERARATADAILEAAAQILVKRGYDGLTTQEVAQAAGVSIGSLYQYFSGKPALVFALNDRQNQAVLDACSEVLRSRKDASVKDVARGVVAALVHAYMVNPALQRVIIQQVSTIAGFERTHAAENRVEALVRAHLSEHMEQLRPRNLELAVFLLVRAVRAAIWATIVERPELLESPEFVEELSALAVGFLTRR